MREERGIAIIVAGGSGTRMKPADTGQAEDRSSAAKKTASEKKQYLDICGKPLMAYAIAAMEQSAYIDDMVVVVSPGDEDYVRNAIVTRYGFTKVRAIVPGGRERCHSVYAGLCAADRLLADGGEHRPEDAVVYIQDAARPFLTEEILMRVRDGVLRHGACVAAMPVKDTIKQVAVAEKQADGKAGGAAAVYVRATPDRSTLWAMQTPQAFRFSAVYDAYRKLMEEERAGEPLSGVTDDAMVVERYFPEQRIFLAEGSYRNIKITTQEDLTIARAFACGETGEMIE